MLLCAFFRSMIAINFFDVQEKDKTSAM